MSARVLILYAAAITTAASTTVSRWETRDLWANQYRYIAIKNFTSLHQPKDDEPFEHKANICKGIIRSNFMDVSFHLNTVDMNDEDFRKELRENYPSIFATYYSAGNDAHTLGASMKQLQFVNPYRLRYITVVDDSDYWNHDPYATFELPEWVFSCLARHRHVGKVVEFFISQQYQLTQSIPNCATRLIFGPDIMVEYKEDVKTIIPIGEAWIPPPGYSFQELRDKYEKKSGGNSTSDPNDKLTKLMANFASDGDYQRQESEERKRRVLENLPNPFSVLLSANNNTKKSVNPEK